MALLGVARLGVAQSPWSCCPQVHLCKLQYLRFIEVLRTLSTTTFGAVESQENCKLQCLRNPPSPPHFFRNASTMQKTNFQRLQEASWSRFCKCGGCAPPNPRPAISYCKHNATIKGCKKRRVLISCPCVANKLWGHHPPNSPPFCKASAA